MRMIASLVLVIGLMFQNPPMPPPGNPDHVEPLPGQVCRHAGPGVDEGHACACEPQCMEGRDEEGRATVVRVEDNAKCRAACHTKHCGCVSSCEP